MSIPGKNLTFLLVMLSSPVLHSGERMRRSRNGSGCSTAVLMAINAPVLEVFLTVNSLSSVSWTGEVYSRKLELNWILPYDSFWRRGDYVGLFRDDPLQGIGQPVAATRPDIPGGYHLTDVSFPFTNLLFTTSDYKLERTCMHNYWVAYIRNNQVLAVNCIKTEPSWMWESRDDIGSVPLHSIMIPGTHNSGSYRSMRGFTDDTVMMRYSINQEEDIWTQLMYGIRYLDLRVSYFEGTPDKFYLVHDFVRLYPLAIGIHAVKRFLRATRELVIMDFHRFPFGFDKNSSARHQDLIDYIETELGEFMAPDWLGRGVTMNDLWHMNRTLIVSYQNDVAEAGHENIWQEVPHAWGDTRETAGLFTFLNRTMFLKGGSSQMWAAMTHLTPTALDIIINPSGGVRSLNNKIARECHEWYRYYWWDKANIVATDFFLSNNLVAATRLANNKRRLCRNRIF